MKDNREIPSIPKNKSRKRLPDNSMNNETNSSMAKKFICSESEQSRDCRGIVVNCNLL
jgi:hypothetical protein